jgi:glycosyltransferase involved in cell wall biosynthesis
MPKIGFVLKGYPRLSETFIAQEIHLLESRGFELEIFSLRGPREKERHPVHEKIRAPITYIPEYIFPAFREIIATNLRSFFRYPSSYLSALLHAIARSVSLFSDSPIKRLLQAGWLIDKKNLGTTEIHHLHSHFVHVPTELTFYLSRITGLTYSISAHAKDIYTIPESVLRERVISSQFLMTCTEFNFQKIREVVGSAEAKKVHKVYHGVNLGSFRPMAPPAALPLRLLTVARLVPKKGFDDMLRALRILRDRGIELRFDIFGEGEQRKEIENWIKEFSLSDLVSLHGAVTQPTVLAAYRAGGVFVLASRETEDGDRDGIPNSLAEAMSMELPVVATNISGIPELVANEKTGLLVPPRDPVALADALERLFREKGLAERLGKAARLKVSNVFDADRCIDSCEQLLRPFIRGNK